MFHVSLLLSLLTGLQPQTVLQWVSVYHVASSLQLSLHFYPSSLLLSPQCLSNCITCRFSLTIRQLFFQSFSSTCNVALSVISVWKWDSRNWQSISLSYVSIIKFSGRTSFLLKSAYKLRHRPLQHTASLTIKMVWIFLGLCCGASSNLCFLVFSLAKLLIVTSVWGCLGTDACRRKKCYVFGMCCFYVQLSPLPQILSK